MAGRTLSRAELLDGVLIAKVQQDTNYTAAERARIVRALRETAPQQAGRKRGRRPAPLSRKAHLAWGYAVFIRARVLGARYEKALIQAAQAARVSDKTLERAFTAWRECAPGDMDLARRLDTIRAAMGLLSAQQLKVLSEISEHDQRALVWGLYHVVLGLVERACWLSGCLLERFPDVDEMAFCGAFDRLLAACGEGLPELDTPPLTTGFRLDTPAQWEQVDRALLQRIPELAGFRPNQ